MPGNDITEPAPHAVVLHRVPGLLVALNGFTRNADGLGFTLEVRIDPQQRPDLSIPEFVSSQLDFAHPSIVRSMAKLKVSVAASQHVGTPAKTEFAGSVTVGGSAVSRDVGWRLRQVPSDEQLVRVTFEWLKADVSRVSADLPARMFASS